MDYFWDVRADRVERGDELREVLPLESRIDDAGITHHVFSKVMFCNPDYEIPESSGKLFDAFLSGGSRHYPSDGRIPVDRVAEEVRKIFIKIAAIASNPAHSFYEKAVKVLRKGEYNLLRGTMALYFRNLTTRDWRRKRSTDDIDFWIWEPVLLEHALKQTGWIKNKLTREWEKRVQWNDQYDRSRKQEVLIASNDTAQAMSFTDGGCLTGSGLENIFSKKLRRGHDVDLSDIINVAIVNSPAPRPEWVSAWQAFEQAANGRSTRTISNMISLCRHSYAIAEHLFRVGEAINQHKDSLKLGFFYSPQDILRVCTGSSHLLYDCSDDDPEDLRKIIYQRLCHQSERKKQYSDNLNSFADKVLDLINSKFTYQKAVIEVT